MDADSYDEKDDSRPFFQRRNGEIGIYMSVYDAEAIDCKSVGLEHFFLMKTTELLYDEFCKMDIVNIRASFEHRRLLKDTYIERFEPGIVMAVGFDSIEGLDAVQELHREKKLNAVMHDILISSAVLKATSVKSVTLETKLWDDEYDVCKRELLARPLVIEPIKGRDEDMKMVNRLKEYQKVIGDEVSVMKDLENEMELSRSGFMNCLSIILPDNQEQIETLKEFDKLVNSDKGRKAYNRECVDLYKRIVKKWRIYYKTFEVEIVTPLLQIHQVCENEKQREIKVKVINLVHDMQQKLLPDNSLQEVSHPETSRKVLRRDAPLFLGLLSLIPIGIERVSDIDLLVDDYMRDYKLEEI